jgi:hypothetical protein
MVLWQHRQDQLELRLSLGVTDEERERVIEVAQGGQHRMQRGVFQDSWGIERRG